MATGTCGCAGRGDSDTDAPEGDVCMDMAVPMDMLTEAIPAADERRAVLARDPLAGVEGVRVIVGLVFRDILGMRYCPKCPDCEGADLLGSNATVVGGCLGRVDGVYGSIEAQKSAGSLHLHVQVFVQRLHQHTSLHDLVQVPTGGLGRLVEEYKKYKGMACR